MDNGYDQKNYRIESASPPRTTIRVEILPRKHEIVVDHSCFTRPDAGPQAMRPEQQMEIRMIEMLRDQARGAYNAVMMGGLSALAARPITPMEYDEAVNNTVETIYARITDVEKDRDNWKQLAIRRGIEVEALERALSRGRG